MEKNNFRKIATITLFESAVQWYCFLLYGTAAGTVFNKVFFSQTGNGTTALILSYMSFAIGYIAGPFGAIFFGHIGDRKGRKVTMYASLLMMGISLDSESYFQLKYFPWLFVGMGIIGTIATFLLPKVGQSSPSMKKAAASATRNAPTNAVAADTMSRCIISASRPHTAPDTAPINRVAAGPVKGTNASATA